ncbi:MAG: ABC transporter substrate-binding protein [Treponema sp.]|jgi:putative aldouronate transport system substrate-binding protein|nr:ABC transporter substrate-binding protein [Treponema sp.]
MKKIAINAVYCTLLLAVVFSVGCKGSSSGAPTLIWWMIGTTQPGFNEDLKIISDYTQEKIGVRLEIKQAGWSESGQRFITIINAGEYFDIMFVDGTFYNRFTTLGAFEDITEFLPVEAPRLWDYIPAILWDGVRVKGRIYSVPTYKDSSVTGFYFWDHKYVEKYKIDLNQSGWAYLDSVFRRMKAGENAPRFYPMPLARGDAAFIFDMYDGLSSDLGTIGVRLNDQRRRVVNTLEQPDILEALRYFHSWYSDGIINPDANMIDESPRGKPFFMAQAWPSVAAAYALQEGVEQYDSVRFFGPSYSTGSIQGSMNAISANSKYKKEALRFLQLVNTDKKLRDMLHMGIEGKHFEYVNNGAAINRLRTDWPLVNYQQGSYFIQTPLVTAPPGYWDEVRKQNEEAKPSVMLGFMMDIEPVLSEVMNCRSVWEKYKIDLLTGASDPDKVLPQIMTELKSGGFDKVLKEAQRQVDEFYK